MTKLFECARRNRLPSAPELLDQGKPFTGADGGLFKVSQTKVLKAATGDDDSSYLVAEEGTLGEEKGGAFANPLSISDEYENTSRWLFTLVLVSHHLPVAAPFKMSPQATLSYVNMM